MRAVSLTTLAIGVILVVAAGHPASGQAGQAQRPPAARVQPAPRQAAPKPPARPPARRRTEPTVPFAVGETLTYDVAWSRFLVAGSAVSRVVEKRPSFGSTAYYIVAEGRPVPLIARLYSMYYKMDSLLDSYTTLSQRTSLYAEEGSARRMVTTQFDRAAKKAAIEVRTTTTVKDEFTVPQNVQDGLATLYTLRSRSLKPGDRLSVPVADEGSVYTANFEVREPEAVSVPLGQVQAWNIRVTILDGMKQQVGSNVGAWISTDARRLPVKLEAELPVGTFALALRTVDQATTR